MTDSHNNSSRQNPPDIPNDAVNDVPFESEDDPSQTPQKVTPEQAHKWNVENLKNNSAFWIIIYCLACLGILALVTQSQVPSSESDAMRSVIDILKAVLMTTLGFLFGKGAD